MKKENGSRLSDDFLQNYPAEAKSFLKHFIEQSPVPMWIGDSAGTLIQTNKALRDAVGVTDEDLVGKYHPLQDPNVHRAGLTETIRNVIEKFISARFSLVWRPEEYWTEGHEQARVRHMDMVMYPIVRDGKLQNLVAQWQDITERKQAENALRESEQRFQAVFNSVDGVPIQGYEKNRRVILWNPASEALYGYSREEALGKNLEDLIIPAEAKQDVVDGIKQWHEKGIPIPSGEIELVNKSGVRLQVYSNHVMITNHHGEKEMFCIDVDLSERKRFENALRESEEQFRTFVENANDIIYRVSPEGVFTYASPNWADVLGYELDEVLGKSIGHFVHPEDVHLCAEFLQEVLSSGQRQNGVEYRVKHKNGTWRWHNSNGAPIKDNEGSVVSYIGIARDITEIKEKEKARSELYERYQTVIKNFPNGAIFLFDSDLNYIHVEGTVLKEVGLVPAEMIGKTVMDVFPPDVSDVASHNQRLLFEGKTCYYEADFAGKTYANWGQPVISANNKIEEGVIFAVDITDRKQTEKDLIRNQRSLELHNKIATVFLTSARDDVFADVLNVILKLLNSRFGYFGYINETGDLVCPSMTRDIWDQCNMPDKSIVFPQSKWAGIWGRSLQEKRTLFANENLNVPSGHVTLDNALATPILHQNKLIGQFVLGNKSGGYDHEDIELLESAATHTAPILYAILEEMRQKVVHEKLEAQLRQAQKMEAVGRLAGGVAHDFNNMLSVVIGHAELILEDIEKDHPFYEDLIAIKQAGIRSADLTRQLLAFARQQTIAPKIIDLNNTVADMLKMLQRLIGENIAISWLPGTDVWPVKIDPSQIDQILANLCVNARDAISEVGKVTIKTANVFLDQDYCNDHTGFTPGEYAMITVKDDGSGMDDETLSHVFEPFFTTKKLGKGTGLGLSTVYGIVKQNNGLISVESGPEQGTTFKIYFPRNTASTPKISEQIIDKTTQRGNETILIVEDEPTILRMTSILLDRQGYKVLTARTPGDAIQLAREHANDLHLLLSDVVMPEMNGRDLANTILQICPKLKCLFFSGYSSKVISHLGVLDDDINFIQKPFSREGLLAKVREVLG